MKNHRYFWILLSFLLSFSLSAAPRSPDGLPAPENRPDHVPGELLVKFRAQTDASVQGSFMAELNARDHRPLPLERLYLITLPRGTDAKAMANLYADDPRIEYAQPNYLYYPQAVPNDTDYGNLWGLKNTGQTITDPAYGTNNPGSAGSDMNAEAAWDAQTDCRSTIVAVVDTGINYTHEDLAANMWNGGASHPFHGWDFVDGDNDPMPGAGENHGTHVAGTIGAVGNNATGTTGVCWQANIMSVRVLGASGGTTVDVISGVDFAVNQGAKVINMSLGGAGGSDGDAFYEAIADAGAAGVLVVIAAGNGGSDGIGDDIDNSTPIYPCAYSNSNIICVAALDQAYALTSFSNYGTDSVDVGAPGANIQSSVAGGVITDDFFSWTRTGDWGIASTEDYFCSAATVPSLVNPADFCASTAGNYANNANDVAYSQFDLSSPSFLGATLSAYVEYSVEDGGDFFDFAVEPMGGNPFGTPDLRFTGLDVTPPQGFSYDLGSCLTATCSIGFRLESDADITSWGGRVFLFRINTLIDGAATYSLYNGTSMATPHVAGLAALVWSYNPDYTYADVASSIVNSGDEVSALSSTTTSGRAVDAFEAIKYIQPPTGVSASVQ